MATVAYCKVVGTFKGFVADSADPDDLPEFSIPTGTGIIRPNVKMVKLNDSVEPTIFYPSPIEVTLDANGRLSQGGRPYVNLLAPTADMNPNNFSYNIIMTLKFDNATRLEIWGPYYLTPVAGTTKDLFELISGTAPAPTDSSGGATYVEDPNNEGFFITA